MVKEILSRAKELQKSHNLYELYQKFYIYTHTTVYNYIDKIYVQLDELYRVDPDTVYYDHYFSKRKKDPFRSDAHIISNILLNKYNPSSVIDFGCGIGIHLEPFLEAGCDVKGVEGSSYALNHLVIPDRFVESHDLRDPISFEENFDLVLSFEVAEHIPERFADIFVDSLTDAGNRIIFSAAPPGQQGHHHVNLQWPEYWHNKFDQRGFMNNKAHVREIQNSVNLEMTEYVTNNLFVYEK